MLPERLAIGALFLALVAMALSVVWLITAILSNLLGNGDDVIEPEGTFVEVLDYGDECGVALVIPGDNGWLVVDAQTNAATRIGHDLNSWVTECLPEEVR